MLLRFTDDSFDEHIQSTIGVDFKVSLYCSAIVFRFLIVFRYALFLAVALDLSLMSTYLLFASVSQFTSFTKTPFTTQQSSSNLQTF